MSKGKADAGDQDDPEARAALDRAAWARWAAPGLTVVAAHRADRLESPIHPGSLFKVIAVRAAIDQRLALAETRIACPRRVEVHGRRVDCVHPDLGRPLALEDAIAHSCNHYFVQLAGRLDRTTVEATARKLLGQPFDTGDIPLPLVVLGLEGPTFGLRTWVRGVLAATQTDVADGTAAGTLVRGLARATTDGTAAALDDPTTLTLAKTGTTLAGDRGEGVVVAWRPEVGEVVAVRAPGLAGRDAARLARTVWDDATRAREPRVRVGRGPRADDRVQSRVRVETLPLETYVAGVVAGEGEASLPAAAMEALAIAVRSYASAPDGRHADEGYDVCDTTHCQRLVPPTSWSHAAAARTRGLVLTRDGRPVAAPYSATCSGTLASPGELWGGEAAVRTRTGPDPGSHVISTWSSDVTAADLLRALRMAGHRGDQLRDVRVVQRTRDGQPARVALDGLAPGELDATTFRHVVGRVLGWDLLKSHAWDVGRTARGYRFEGRGKGHGAGLCVRGAAMLAARGDDATQLLRTYVPGAAAGALQDRVTVQVPHGRQAEAPQLLASVRATLADLRLRLLVATPRQVDVRLHPTVEAYQRSTGRAWWTGGATTRTGAGTFRLDLAPSSAARNLAATLRHELVHVLTMDVLTLAPAWADEGLATLVGRSEGDGAVRVAHAETCPSADEIRRPGRHAIGVIYLRAAACVNRALPDGLASWRRLAGDRDAPPEQGRDVYAQ